DAPSLSAEQVRALVFDEGATARLADDLQIRSVRVMHARRIEITGLTAAALPRWKAEGLTTEIINYKTRAFIPVGSHGLALLEKILSSYPVVGILRR
ncbi:MAG: hypothetical protein ACRED4_00470, partial [Brevundimonas sp.]